MVFLKLLGSALGLRTLLSLSLIFPAPLFAQEIQTPPSEAQEKEELSPHHLMEEIEETLKDFVPEASPENSRQLIDAILKQKPTLFQKEYLESNLKWFEEEARRDLGVGSDVTDLSYSMFQQWLYLELFKAYRSEYLMVSYARVLPLIDGITADQAVQRFDRLFPDGRFKDLPDVEVIRDSQSQGLRTLLSDAQEVQKAKDTLLGSSEASYLSLAYIDRKLEFLQKRFDESDDRYVKEKQKLDEWRSTVYSGNSLLHTRAFQDEVEPFYRDEVQKTLDLRERASNDFQFRFSKFIEESRTIKDFVDYLSNGELEALAKDMALAFTLPQQNTFRQRIAQAFDAGVEEIVKNLEEVGALHYRQFLTYPLRSNIVQSNLWTKVAGRSHPQWLVEVFRENIVHWLIVEEFPYFQKTAETLTNFVSHELSQQGWNRWKLYAGLGTLMMFSSLGRRGNKFSSWLGRGQTVMRVGALVVGGYVTYQMAIDLYGQYQQWKMVQRLARLSVDGLSLSHVFQEEAIQTGLMWQAAWTGVSAFMNIWAAGRLRTAAKVKTGESWLKGVTRSTWEGSPLAAKDIFHSLSTNLKNTLRSSGSGKAMLAGAGSAAMDIMTFFTQLVVMVPASMPVWAKGLINSIRGQLFTSAILGTVMGVMSVTVQNYINAAALKALTFAFEKAGYAVPAYWQLNTMSLDHRTKRDAFIFLYGHVFASKKEVARSAGNLVLYQSLLADPANKPDDLRRLRLAIDQEKENIDNELFKLCLLWYERFEFRSLINSLLKELNFGLLVSPSMEEPVRMTILLRIGDGVFTHSTTKSHIENLKSREALPNFDLNMEEIREFLEKLPDRILG